MKAFILAAGIGSRLSPLTDDIPKAMVPVAGKPMILHLLERLAGLGITQFVVNLHHHADKLQSYLESLSLPCVTIEYSDERDALLDTGGALKRAAGYFGNGAPFLIHNVDVWTTLSPFTLLNMHRQSGALATLAVRNRVSSRYLLFNNNMRLSGWENRKTGEKIIVNESVDRLSPLAFSGVQIVSPELFDHFPHSDRFSLIELYLQAASSGRIKGVIHDTDEWYDLGTPENIQRLDDH